MRGWSVRVYCPHGVCHEMPLDWLYRLKPPVDMCPEAEEVEQDFERPGKLKTWRELRRLRKEMRDL